MEGAVVGGGYFLDIRLTLSRSILRELAILDFITHDARSELARGTTAEGALLDDTFCNES